MKNSGLEFDPIDYYQKILKDEVNVNATKQIEELTKVSNIDTSENKILAKKVYQAKKKFDEQSKILSRYKILRGFLVFLCVVCFIFGIVGIALLVNGNSSLFPILAIAIGFSVGLILLLIILLVLNKKIQHINDTVLSYQKEYNKQLALALNNLVGLKNLFNYRQFVNLVNNSNTVISLDYEVSQKKLLMLENIYNLNLSFDINESILDVYSGNIEKNPFLRVLLNTQKMKDVTYTGTRVVSWTETYRDSEGHTHTRVESETLVAHYSAPAPFYSDSSIIIYGNEAAPNLSFSRFPSGISKEDDEKDIEKFIKKKTKKIEKEADKAIKKGKNFVNLANTDFESLFGALNRDNETEYRLLFTPLAQQNMTEIITSKEPYGDDFAFIKRKKINFIYSRHSSNNIRFNYYYFSNYFDYEKLKTDYVTMMNKEFASLYFDVAPILAIPLYQMHEAGIYDPALENEQITLFEAEAFVNHMGENLFAHPESTTRQVLKISRLHNNKESDVFKVSAHSFKAVSQVEVVPVMCRNGRIYDVPVTRYRYDPLVKESNVAITKIKENKNFLASNNNDSTIYRYHDFASCMLGDNDLNEGEDTSFVNSVRNKYNLFK